MSFNFNFTIEQLRQLVPNAAGGPEAWYDSLCDALPQYQISTVERVAAFIAQCAHESGGFRVLEENLNYSGDALTKIWPKHFDASNKNQYNRNPEAIANRAYRDRMGNGNESSGEGWKYRGRGLIQLTGKSNYSACSDALFQDNTLVENPDILLDPYYALHSACWFWNKNGLNAFADSGDIKTMTKRINGGFIGLEDRIKHYEHAVAVLGGSH